MNKNKLYLIVFTMIVSLVLAACSTGGQPVPTASAADLRSTANAMDATSPAAISTVPTAAPTITTGYCPTRREVNDMLFGLNADGTSQDRVVEVSTEDGTWQINTGSPEFYYPVKLVADQGLIASIHRPNMDLAEVWIGDGSTQDVFRGTFRFQRCFSPDDDMSQPDAAIRILVKENFNGTYQTWLENKRVQDWQFSVIAGNFECPADVCPVLAPAATSAPAASASCPTFGGVQTTAGNDGGPYCKYKGSVVTDNVPSGYKADYWDGNATKYAVSGKMIVTGEATFRRP